MTPEIFLREFGALVETEGGVDRLRDLVREFAARGVLARSGPANRVELQDVALDFKNGISKRSGKEGIPTPVLRLADIKNGQISPKSLREIRLTPDEREKYSVDDGDILIIRVNGSADLVGSFVPCLGVHGYAYSDHLIRLRLDQARVDYRYLCVVARSQSAREHIVGKTVSTAGQKTVNQKGLGSLSFPLPSRADQKLIVEKVDQLMALCDELEEKQKKKRATSVTLNKAALNAVVTAPDAKTLKSSWKRVQDQFEVLYDLPENVGELRRAVLELAVRGHLTREHEGDAPVDVLLKQIARERAESAAGRRKGGGRGTLRKPEALEPPFPIPDTWVWSRLADVAGHIVDGTHHTPRYVERGIDFISAKDIRNGGIRFEGCRQISREEFEELAFRCRPRAGDVLVTKSGSIGEVAIVHTDHDFTLFESVALVPVVPSVSSRYVAIVTYLGASGEFGRSKQKGVAVRHLHLVDLRDMPLPLPPRSRQDRIVEKVDQLMEMCNGLNDRLKKSAAEGQRLMQAVVETLVA